MADYLSRKEALKFIPDWPGRPSQFPGGHLENTWSILYGSQRWSLFKRMILMSVLWTYKSCGSPLKLPEAETNSNPHTATASHACWLQKVGNGSESLLPCKTSLDILVIVDWLVIVKMWNVYIMSKLPEVVAEMTSNRCCKHQQSLL